MERINIYKTNPKAYDGVFALEKFIEGSPLNKKEISLIKMRASQINGCAYCLNMHIKEAIKAGETLQRLHLLATWKDSNLFNEVEKLILEMTEEVTLIHRKGLIEATYQKAISLFDEQTIIAIIMTISTINVWNRIAISTKLPID